MAKIKISLFIAALFAKTFSFSQEVKFQGKLSGIKSSKGVWLTQPVYKSIQVLRTYEDGSYKTRGFLASKQGSEVIIAPDGKTLASPAFESIVILNQNDNLFAVKKNGKFSFFRLGEGVLKNYGEFEEYHPVVYYPDHFVLKRNGKSVMADLKNKIVSPKEFESISDDVVAWESTELLIGKIGHWGVSDMKGNEHLPFVYDSLKFFFNLDGSPYVVLYKGGKTGLARTSGQIMADCKYEGFNDGFFRQISEGISSSLIPVKQNGKWGCIDSSGKWIINPDYDELRAVLAHQQIAAKKAGKMGILDFKGKQVYPFTYENIDRIDAGRLIESKHKNYLVSNGPNSGITDSTGKVLVPVDGILIPLYTKHYFVGENEAKFEGYEDSSLVGYIRNTGGKLKKYLSYSDSVVQMQFDETGNETMFNVLVRDSNTCLKGGKNGIVDEFGKTIVPVQYDDMYLYFFDTRNEDRVRIPKYISSENAPPRNLFRFNLDTTSFSMVKTNGKWGVINYKKNYQVVPCEYDSVFFDYNSSGYDASDSMFAVKGFPRRLYQVFKGGKYGYYSDKGKELVSPQIGEDFRDLAVFPYDSLIREAFEPYQEHNQSFGRIVISGGTRKTLLAYSSVEGWDADGGPLILSVPREIILFENAKYNILDAGKVKMETPWSEDLILFSKSMLQHKISDLRSQFKLSGAGGDSVCDAKTGKRVFQDITTRYDDIYFFNYYFSKENGKWYLRDMTRPEKQGAGGFDSVQMVNDRNFIAWKGGEFWYYDIKSKGPFDNWMKVEYPSAEMRTRFVCSNCEFSMKKYPAVNKYMQYDEYGNERGDTVVHYFIEIPIVKKGKYNIIDSSNRVLFKTWPDEIIFPKDNEGHYFSMSDTSSSVFILKNLEEPGYPFYGTLNKTVALRYGDKWRLQSVSKPEIFVDGFKEVKLEGDKWAVKKKKKKVLYFSVADLKKIKQ